MKVVSDPGEMKNLSLSLQRIGRRIGLVPTMGALHDGHLSLLSRCRGLADTSVVSIFVNPAQFGPSEDFDTYPRAFENDCRVAEENGCDVVFAPRVSDMYPGKYDTYVTVERLGTRLCGASRPAHFRGVTTVVLKLFNIVMPQVAVFGRKDAQQAIIIRRMISDLNLSVTLDIAPVVREDDGLAVSSRNAYLTGDERKEAGEIYKGLCWARELYQNGERNAGELRTAMMQLYDAARSFNVEYTEIVDPDTLDPVDTLAGTVLIAVAVRTKWSKTRLIDNVIVGGEL
ncbi:MAG: pantoate--beta-alanine ligase [Chitinivibrionales bacterium]|nr:pantoate--beta-alanine ligase [Chitinivibrionales bacterium]MBD3394895.1 pantoate--beta-alanine ligase [Chitinivibrionales bacterium]